jgi:hypothetical protein
MSTQPIVPVPTDPAATPPASGATEPPKPTEPAAAAPVATPPWGEDFDAEKAWGLVQGLRSDKEKLQKRPTLSDDDKAKLDAYDKVLESQKTAEQKAQDAAAAAETRVKSLIGRAVQAEVKALAADGFADPSDAAAFLTLDKYATADGDVDTEAIKADLADLLVRKPHLGKSPTTRVPAPNPAQGGSGGGLVATDIDAQIVEATKAGNHQLAIALKQQRSADLLAKKS